jgi:hypothetical protein
MDALSKDRLHLSADGLYRILRSEFAGIPDHRCRPEISLVDALMSGFALFALKAPSLFAFEEQRRHNEFNLKGVFGIKRIPCDTQMRAIDDEVDPQQLRSAFAGIFRQLQRGKALEPFVFFQGQYLLAIDGTSYFSSEKIHCPSCLEKKSRNGKIAYSHQMLAAALVHPDRREVIPLCPEPIIKQDGDTKNDCERNASRRFLEHFRREHPHLAVIVVEDALSANAPHLDDLRAANLRFIIGVKPGSHAFLFEQMRTAFEAGQVRVLTLQEADGTLHHYRWLEKASLNESHADVLVTMIDYWEIRPNKRTIYTIYHFSWITDLPVDQDTVPTIASGGRARWHIENETINTLKNQGYQFDHNFGHGYKNLSVVFAFLMMLAFLVDQTQQLCCPLFQAAWEKLKTKRQLWEVIRHLFHSFLFNSFSELLEAVVRDIKRTAPNFSDTS